MEKSRRQNKTKIILHLFSQCGLMSSLSWVIHEMVIELTEVMESKCFYLHLYSWKWSWIHSTDFFFLSLIASVDFDTANCKVPGKHNRDSRLASRGYLSEKAEPVTWPEWHWLFIEKICYLSDYSPYYSAEHKLYLLII